MYTPGLYSFNSAFWNTHTHPDLVITTRAEETTYEVLPNYPKSQHLPLIAQLGSDKIEPVLTSCLPRWNFMKANWKMFRESMEEAIENIPSHNLQDWRLLCELVRTCAKKSIPKGVRKSYIPGRDKKIQHLYKISQSGSTLQEWRQAGGTLLEGIGKRQARWIERVEEIDFSISSRKASSLKNLGNRQQSKTKKTVYPNPFASRLMETSKISKVEEELNKEINRFIKEWHALNAGNKSLKDKITVAEVKQHFGDKEKQGNRPRPIVS